MMFRNRAAAVLVAAALVSVATPCVAKDGRKSALWTGVGAAVLGGVALNALANRQPQYGYAAPAYAPAGYGYPDYGYRNSYPSQRMCTVSDGYETVNVPCNSLQVRRGY